MIAGVLTYGLVASPETVQRQSEKHRRRPAGRRRVRRHRPARLTDLDVIGLARHRPGHRPGAGDLRRVRRRRQPRHRDQPDVRTARPPQLRRAEGAGSRAHRRRDRLLRRCRHAGRRRPGRARLRACSAALRWVARCCAAIVAGDRRPVPRRSRPSRGEHGRLISKGVLVASALWIVVSVGFSVYVDNFGSYGKTYGALAGVVVLLLWLWIGMYALLLGATVEALTRATCRTRPRTKAAAPTTTASRMSPLISSMLGRLPCGMRSSLRSVSKSGRSSCRSTVAASALPSDASSARAAASTPLRSGDVVVPTPLTSIVPRAARLLAHDQIAHGRLRTYAATRYRTGV